MRRRVVRSQPETHGAAESAFVSNRVDTEPKKKKRTKTTSGHLRMVEKLPILREQSYEAGRKAVDLKLAGSSIYEIAKELHVQAIDVPKLLLGGLREYYADRDKAVEQYVALTDARYDKIYRTLMPLACGRVETITNEEGEEVQVVHEPNMEAMSKLLTAIRDHSKMKGLNKTKVEITGKDGEALKVQINVGALNSDQLKKLAESIDRGDESAIQSFRLLGEAANATGTTR